MDTITRRKFLQLTAGTSVGAAVSLLSLDEIVFAANTRPLVAGTPILVVVTLYGGNDGLNTVIPFKDPIYYSSRPDISYKAEEILQLDSQFGLNPSMTQIANLWKSGKVAIVRGAGYPSPDRSHFSSMAKWQSGSPTTHSNSGWIGRWIDSQPDDPMLAISLGSVLPPLLAGVKKVGSALPLGGLVIPKGTIGADFRKLSSPSTSDSKLRSLAANSMKDLFNISETITPILMRPEPKEIELPTINGGNAGGDSNLAQQLNIVSKLIQADAPTRVWSVSLGGFDTHANEANAQSILLGSVSSAIDKFMMDIKTSKHGSNVVVLVYSEFGRRVAGNASKGTDHGTSGPMFIIGDKIKGGFYGEQPSLSKLVDGDLAVTSDFRDVYATLLEDVLKSPAERYLNNWKGRTNFYKAR
ncbi:hypothetical protein GM51_4050 [freshwater metagenome]|jgi:uncharacterized protein (DUF1501 family)|uniref:DUF1501 domain-containing protein n=1 Tax=freshwater metagenome TaxID=449393 RepID=A0A094Q9Z7_9ZZZZ